MRLGTEKNFLSLRPLKSCPKAIPLFFRTWNERASIFLKVFIGLSTSMRMQSLSGTIKSNKHDGLHLHFMSFAPGWVSMCALSGPNGLSFVAPPFPSVVFSISQGQYNGQWRPGQLQHSTLLKFFPAIAFFLFCCNSRGSGVGLGLGQSVAYCGASARFGALS